MLARFCAFNLGVWNFLEEPLPCKGRGAGIWFRRTRPDLRRLSTKKAKARYGCSTPAAGCEIGRLLHARRVSYCRISLSTRKDSAACSALGVQAWPGPWSSQPSGFGRSKSYTDCCIAAVAIRVQAPLATSNRGDFTPMLPYDLVLA